MTMAPSGPSRGLNSLFVDVTGVTTITEFQQPDTRSRSPSDDTTANDGVAMLRATGLEDVIEEPDG